MRAAAHLFALVVLVPQALVFAAITLLKHVTKERTFFAFLGSSLDALDLLFGWGGAAVLVAVAALIAAAFSERFRPFAAAGLLAANLYSAVSIAIWLELTSIGDGAFFFTPAVLSAAACVWVSRPLFSK